MTITHHIKPVSVKKTERGTYIVDFGQNMAGWVQMNMRGNAGDTIKIKYAERLDENGDLYIKNLRDAETEDKYICSGKENGTPWHSVFSYHGFRFVEVKGMKSLAATDLEAQAVADRLEFTGNFSTSNNVLNNVYKNAWWGIISNYKGFPLDCPQRNERQPWLGDHTVGTLASHSSLETSVFTLSGCVTFMRHSVMTVCSAMSLRHIGHTTMMMSHGLPHCLSGAKCSIASLATSSQSLTLIHISRNG